MSEVAVAWEGGEPTVTGLDFYHQANKLEEKHRRPVSCRSTPAISF
jgi:sulfatase maturation enzyme AslB (radical SAM superfamily)